MRTRISVALNGIELHSLDGAIVLQGVDEGAPSWNITTGNRASREGQYINGIEKRYRDVVVSFAIAETRDLIRRADILQRVCAWAAAGGDLTVSYRDRQRLRVVCAALPAVKTLTKWAEAYSITFRAYTVPYWESMDAESVTANAATSTSSVLTVRETAGGKLCFEATNSSGSQADTAVINCNGGSIGFLGLGLLNGEKLILDYDGKDIQRIRILNAAGTAYRSAMAKRTTGSSDDLILKQGSNTIVTGTGETNIPLGWKFYTYGRWE